VFRGLGEDLHGHWNHHFIQIVPDRNSRFTPLDTVKVDGEGDVADAVAVAVAVAVALMTPRCMRVSRCACAC
jgi:hypothetical protein